VEDQLDAHTRTCPPVCHLVSSSDLKAETLMLVMKRQVSSSLSQANAEGLVWQSFFLL
jgi:hypothetical protein